MAEPKTAREALEFISSHTSGDSQGRVETFRIGDLAREFDVSLRTLRFYEDRGLLHPERSGSTRLYSRSDRDRLRVILATKSAGFSLIDIEEMLKIYDTNDPGREALDNLVQRFSAQLDVLAAQKIEIENAISMLQTATQQLNEVS